MSGKKLYIYDATSETDIDQADGRFGHLFSDSPDTMPVTSMKSLLIELEALVKKGRSYNSILFQTHGAPGSFWFDEDRIGSAALLKYFTGKKFDSLARRGAHIHFDGCNIAEGKRGFPFLEAVGSVFMRTGGGRVSGWTSLGIGMPGGIPIVGGHTIHFYGFTRSVTYNITGGIISRIDPQKMAREAQFKFQPRQSIDLF